MRLPAFGVALTVANCLKESFSARVWRAFLRSNLSPPQQFQITYRSPESSLLGAVERLKRCRVVTAELGEFIGD